MYSIHTTWAIVGALFAENKEQLNRTIERNFSNEAKGAISSFLEECMQLKENEEEDTIHFASSLIEDIQHYKNQEIGLHTFSHFFCLENDDNIKYFKNDTLAAIDLMKKKGVCPKSFVFPRNQYNEEVLEELKELGISNIRGNESHKIYTQEHGKEGKFKRLLRLVDSYYNLTGYHTYSPEKCLQKDMYNFPSSRFLRPYTPSLALMERRKIDRIKKAMTHASQQGEIFHLWFHPHNFGKHREENIKNLIEICSHYEELKKKYQFKSCTMDELAEILKEK